MRVDHETRKAILSDPVAAFQERQGTADAQALSAVTELVTEYRGLQSTHTALQEETGILSRKIGAAKRDGAPTDELLSAMRTHSARLKEVSGRLAEIETHILAHFNDHDSGASTSAPGQTRIPATRYRLSSPPGEGLTITALEQEHDAWNDYVESHAAATVYHRAEWRAVIRDSFGHDALYLMARDGSGQVCGVLPLIRISSRLFGDFMISMPYFNYGGALAEHPQIELRLMEVASAQAARMNVDYVEYRDTIERDGYAASTRKVNMLLPLPDDSGTLWNGFPPKLRAQIRRAQRETPQVRFGGEELLDDFHDVFSRNMRDLGTPVYGRDFFRNILRAFPDRCRIVVLYLSGKPVATGFLTGYRDMLEIPWASTLRSVNHLSMNMLLYWSVLEYAIDNRYRRFDFGRSSVDSGTFRFKRQWGAQPLQLYWHYWLSTGDGLPSLNPDNPKYRLAIGIWKRLPLFVTRRLGPPIVKYLP